MTVTDIRVTFSPHHVLKHSKPGKKLDSFHYKTCHNKKSYFVGCLKEYLNCRNIKVQTDNKALLKTFQGSGNRFIEKMGERTFHRNVILKRPHHTPVDQLLPENQGNYQDIAKILKQGCWKNAKTFFDFYKNGIVYYASDDIDFINISP